MSFQVGETVDHYRLDQVVAQHASMTVYAAFDLRLLRRVALNELPAELVTGDSVRARFTSEAAAAAQLDHPDIVPVYDSNEHDGSLYYVTKFVDGVTLSELQRSRPATIAESMIYLDQLAAALDYIHRRGVVHGGVRPSNVLIATGELPHSAQLFDVGITTRIEPGPDSANWFATADPTRVDAEGRRVDVVGLARTAFELLTRRAPEDALASASMIDRQLPPAVDSVFADVLDGERDMTCGQFVAALRRALPAEMLVFRPPLTPGSAAPEPAAPAPPGPAARRSPAVLAASIAAAVILVLGIVWWQGSGSTNADETIGSVAPPTQVTAPTLVAPPTTVAPTTSTRPPSTTAAPTTTEAVSTTAETTTVEASTTLPPANPYGDIPGRVITDPASVQGQAAVALQARSVPDTVAGADTPAWFYAEWLRLVTAKPTAPVVATNDGYAIDAGMLADLAAFQLRDDGRVTSFTECANGACNPLTDGIEISPECRRGVQCNLFATDDRQVAAVLRATVLLRLPSISLLFKLSSQTHDVAAVSDPFNTVRWDPATGYFSITLPAAPPSGTETAVTITYVDGGRSKMTITWGS